LAASAAAGAKSSSLSNWTQSIRWRLACGRQFMFGPLTSPANRRSSIFVRILFVAPFMASHCAGAAVRKSRTLPAVNETNRAGQGRFVVPDVRTCFDRCRRIRLIRRTWKTLGQSRQKCLFVFFVPRLDIRLGRAQNLSSVEG
jgi:hypothetical protein